MFALIHDRLFDCELDRVSIQHASRCACFVLLFLTSGCNVTPNASVLPADKTIVCDQLVINSDFTLPKKHRLLAELTLRRSDIAARLQLPTSDEPINVYLYKNETDYRKYMVSQFPDFRDRRALFVKDDTSLKVIAHWGPRVGEDLRHEVTHGYLHSVVPNLPLWLDEGIAEYFETQRGKRGFNSPHVYLLSNAFRRGDWTPDLQRLEAIKRPESLTQSDYAEAWLWVHFLIESDTHSRKFLQDYLARLRMSGQAGDVTEKLEEWDLDVQQRLLDHLKTMIESM